MGIFRTTYNITEQRVAPAYPQTVNVTEKRAPTDDSVRLLREMEEKATAQIVESYRIETNVLNGVVVIFLMDPADFDRKAWIRFNLNGKDYSFKETFRWNEFTPTTKHDAIQMFVKAVREAIYENIMPELAKALDKNVQETRR